jgi:uncharacterized membrane protein (UPF0127 family)
VAIEAGGQEWHSGRMSRRFLHASIARLFVGLALVTLLPVAARAEILQIVTQSGASHLFQVTLADTPEKQARGLMHVENLPPQNGMVFPMDPPRKARFWMRNTLVPLDMIFIKPGGTIAQIVTRRDTQSDAHTGSQDIVSGVLEINAGEAAKLNIGIGERVILSGVRF